MDMNESVINKPIVLNLNGSWMPIGTKSVQQAIKDMCSGTVDHPPALALDIEYEKNEAGEWDFENPVYMNPVKWADWINLPVKEYHMSIHTVSREIRVPTIIISPNFNQVPMKKVRPTKSAIWERDGGVCQYTGEKVGRNTADIDHIVPVSRGGANTFANMVLCKKEINRLKGNKYNHEVGLKLIRQPKEPSSIPISSTFKDVKHPTWKHFLIGK
jgi:5-methylcytosine-specific restriction endonuclease McrA